MLSIFSLTLPLIFSGIVAVIIIKYNIFPQLTLPLDNGRTLAGNPILGKNKTVRGVLFHIISTIILCFVLYGIAQRWPYSFIHPVFSHYSPLILGLIYGGGYCFGEIINSFVKRRLGIVSGKTTTSHLRPIQKTIDLADGICIVAVLMYAVTGLPALLLIYTVIIGIGIHFLFEILMRLLGIKK